MNTSNARPAGAIRRTAGFLALALAACALAAALPATSSGEPIAHASRAELFGVVRSAWKPLRGFEVTLYRSRARSSGGGAIAIGSGRTDRRGFFWMGYPNPRDRNAVLYLVASRGPVALGTVLGTKPVRRHVVINERTTVAMGYSEAQFLNGRKLAGQAPGPQNASLMARNLVKLRNGQLSAVVNTPPNGRQTATRRTFNALSNMVAFCVRSRAACATFLRLAKPPGRRAPRTTLQAIVDIARNPWHNVRALFRYSRSAPRIYRLARTSAPSAWFLALRFDGDGQTMNGPGNFAIDAKGTLWVANNFVYEQGRRTPACDSHLLLRFTPAGRFYPGSPYKGGGVSGVGYGITIDPKNRVWVGNMGFSAPPPYCPVPPSDSVSRFGPRGVPLSPPSGFAVGGITFPQGTASDRKGNIWVASCGFEDTSEGTRSPVTRIPGGNAAAAEKILDAGIDKGFGLAINHRGQVFVAGTRSNTVGVLNNDGTPAPGSPITGGGLNRPMGVTVDSRGNIWVANSGIVDLPCPPPPEPSGAEKPSITMIGRDGKPVRDKPFTGGGLRIAWGINVDGNDHVWVANFGGQRLSEFCGSRPKRCPVGKRRTGRAISPNKTGYRFRGFTRLTGVAIDPAGNVWATNNFLNVPATYIGGSEVLLNPGGYQIVALVGAAAPLKTPVIGPPRALPR